MREIDLASFLKNAHENDWVVYKITVDEECAMVYMKYDAFDPELIVSFRADNFSRNTEVFTTRVNSGIIVVRDKARNIKFDGSSVVLISESEVDSF